MKIARFGSPARRAFLIVALFTGVYVLVVIGSGFAIAAANVSSDPDIFRRVVQVTVVGGLGSMLAVFPLGVAMRHYTAQRDVWAAIKRGTVALWIGNAVGLVLLMLSYAGGV